MPPSAPHPPPPPPPPANAFGFGSAPSVSQAANFPAQAEFDKRYRLIRQVSEGGMGKLYLAQELSSGRFVALKTLHDQLRSQEEMVHQFIREAVITARLQHPSIIPIYDLGFLQSHTLYYTMRFVEGGSLESTMGNFTLPERLRIFQSIVSAVAFAHERGIWHRDIKPQNILVGKHGDAYLIDWGIVTVIPGREYKLELPQILLADSQVSFPDDLMLRTHQAITGRLEAMLGTPMYMPPEAFNGDGVDEKADVWALGLVLYELLGAGYPFLRARDEEVSTHELFMRVKTQPIAAPHHLSGQVSEELSGLCLRMLDRKPDQRPSINDVLRLFQEAAVRAGPTGQGLPEDSRSPYAPPSATEDKMLRLQRDWYARQYTWLWHHASSLWQENDQIRRFVDALLAESQRGYSPPIGVTGPLVSPAWHAPGQPLGIAQTGGAPSGPGPAPAPVDGRATLSGQPGVFTVLPGTVMRVGRDPAQCQLVLQEPRISPVHASLHLAGGVLYVCDEQSHNGTRVNGSRIASDQWVPVPPGATLAFGPIELTAVVT